VPVEVVPGVVVVLGAGAVVPGVVAVPVVPSGGVVVVEGAVPPVVGGVGVSEVPPQAVREATSARLAAARARF